jgi:hypothetical protein
MVLMRAQASDAVPGILPLVVVGSAFLSLPEFADPCQSDRVDGRPAGGISRLHADTIIENLYRAKEEPPDIE